MDDVSTCKMCDERPADSKSHIIPKSIFLAHMEDGETPHLIASSGTHPKRAPHGVYDQTILCRCCEKRFSSWDNYGKWFLLDAEYKVALVGTDVEHSIVENVDYGRLKLFFLAVLWRAAVSTQPFFSAIKIGPHSARIRKLLLANDPGGIQDYAVLLERFSYPADAIPVLSPLRRRVEGLNFVSFLMNGVLAQIKVDRRSCHSSFSDLVLAPDRPAVLLHKRYQGSAEHQSMRRAALKSPLPSFWRKPPSPEKKG
jgi:hypothetical protein